jgi:predicted oxidoreductase
MTTLRLSTQPRPLGKSGISVFPIAWGMWRLAGDDVGDARRKVEAALDAGITLFDTADIYGCDTPAGFGSAEALFGRVLADAPNLRDRMVIATKGGIMPGIPYDSSTTYLANAIDSSLSRMGIDQIDLYQIHRRDFLTHPQEVAASLTAMVDSGKVRALGVSNYSTDELAALQNFLSLPLVSTQPEFSALRTAPLFDGTLDQAMARDMAVLAWSPLGGGRLVAGEHPAATLIAEQGARFGVDASAASLSWIMAHPARPIPIVGSQSPERITRSVDAFKVEWTRSEWYAVLEASLGERLP